MRIKERISVMAKNKNRPNSMDKLKRKMRLKLFGTEGAALNILELEGNGFEWEVWSLDWCC